MVWTRSMRKSERDLPPELTEEILCFLRVKDLLRFRAVCKAWKTLIDSNRFKNKHFEAANNFRSTLLICRRPRATRQLIIDLMSPTEFSVSHSMPLHLSQFVERFSRYEHTYPDFYTFGLVNGIVCLVYTFCFVLWNPSTRWFRSIDNPPRKTLKELNMSRIRHDRGDYCAFWFDKKTEDYKIVIAQFTIKEKALIQLYSSRTNTWKGLTQDFPFVVSFFRSDAPLDGSFYWFAILFNYNDDGSSPPAIFRFDFCDEVFELITLPKDFAAPCRSVVVTTRGCLELISVFVTTEQRCEVWAMGESGSWSRKLRFGLGSQVRVPRGITKDGQLILQSGEELSLINATTGSCENLELGTVDSWVYTYVESLFSFKH